MKNVSKQQLLEERVTVEQLTGGIQAGQWLARGPFNTPLVIRSTREEALREGVEWARQKRMQVNGFL